MRCTGNERTDPSNLSTSPVNLGHGASSDDITMGSLDATDVTGSLTADVLSSLHIDHAAVGDTTDDVIKMTSYDTDDVLSADAYAKSPFNNEDGLMSSSTTSDYSCVTDASRSESVDSLQCSSVGYKEPEPGSTLASTVKSAHSDKYCQGTNADKPSSTVDSIISNMTSVRISLSDSALHAHSPENIEPEAGQKQSEKSPSNNNETPGSNCQSSSGHTPKTVECAEEEEEQCNGISNRSVPSSDSPVTEDSSSDGSSSITGGPEAFEYTVSDFQPVDGGDREAGDSDFAESRASSGIVLPERYRHVLRKSESYGNISCSGSHGGSNSSCNSLSGSRGQELTSREKDLGTALAWIRHEMVQMKEQDKMLMKRFIELRASILQLRCMYDVTCSTSDLSSSMDGSSSSLNELRKSSRRRNMVRTESDGMVSGGMFKTSSSLSLPCSPQLSRLRWNSSNLI